MKRWCLECGKEFKESGRELVCSALCKVINLTDKTDSCWFLRRTNRISPSVKFKDKFYNARRILWDNDKVQRLLVLCSFNKRCINPAHMPESPKRKGLIEWIKSLCKEYIYGVYE